MVQQVGEACLELEAFLGEVACLELEAFLEEGACLGVGACRSLGAEASGGRWVGHTAGVVEHLDILPVKGERRETEEREKERERERRKDGRERGEGRERYSLQLHKTLEGVGGQQQRMNDVSQVI